MTARSKFSGPQNLTVLPDPGLIRVKRYMCEKVTAGPVYSKSAFDYLGEFSAKCHVTLLGAWGSCLMKKEVSKTSKTISLMQ